MFLDKNVGGNTGFLKQLIDSVYLCKTPTKKGSFHQIDRPSQHSKILQWREL